LQNLQRETSSPCTTSVPAQSTRFWAIQERRHLFQTLDFLCSNIDGRLDCQRCGHGTHNSLRKVTSRNPVSLLATSSDAFDNNHTPN
jgi:hypothetical protein